VRHAALPRQGPRAAAAPDPDRAPQAAACAPAPAPPRPAGPALLLCSLWPAAALPHGLRVPRSARRGLPADQSDCECIITFRNCQGAHKLRAGRACMPQGLSGAGRAAHARARARAAFLSSAAQSLLRALLEREPGRRLGAGLQGSEAVMAHPFFRPICWARLLRREARQGPHALNTHALYPCRAAHCHAAPGALRPGRAATAAAGRA